MSRISSTFGKQGGLKSSPKLNGGSYLTDVPLTFDMKKSGSLRKSGGVASSFAGTLSGKLANSVDLSGIEAEYIKNLQQQIYFLELEANYLREQAKKATKLHPHMTAEAERMLGKLRLMQEELDRVNLELKRKDSSLELVTSEKIQISEKLKAEEETHTRHKRLLTEEVVQLKKEKDLLERENTRKDTQILQAQEEMERSATELRNTEHKINILKNQLEQKTEQHKLTQQALEEKRTEQLQTETKLRETEDKYFSSTASVQEKVVQDLRDEIRLLRQKLKETEMAADQDRYLRTKMTDDSAHLVKENALLNQQVLEMQKQLDRERGLRESNDNRRSQNISELVIMKDREKTVRFELEQVKEQFQHEQERVKHYMDQLSKQEAVNTTTDLGLSTTRSKLAELEAMYQNTESENNALRRDKMLLVDHTAELQRQFDEKNREVQGLRANIHSLETRVKEVDNYKAVESSLNSQKWDELSRIAENMKSLTRSMAQSSLSEPHSTRMADYA